MIEQSESTAKLVAAMVKFRTMVDGIAKDSKNPHFKNNYASVGAILDEVSGPLAKCGLVVFQFPDRGGEKMASLTTQLSHVSGEFMRCTGSMEVAKRDPQGYGSSYTYARRYALLAVLGIEAYDDDGNAGSSVKGR